MIDLFEIRPTDRKALGELADLLHDHCDVAQVEQFLSDLTYWHQVKNQHHKPRQQAEARQELEQWQEFIRSITPTTPEAA